MKIAVASQNRNSITDHAGHCRKFWIYQVEQGLISQKKLLELAKEQSFHESSPHDSHPLDDVQVLLAGNMGLGLTRRLNAKGINAIITPETDPDRAVAAFLDGSLEISDPKAHDHDGHGHHQHAPGHGHECHCGG